MFHCDLKRHEKTALPPDWEPMKSTPWGKPQTIVEVAPGIVFYSTPGHGGIHLDRQQQRQFKAIFPHFETQAGGPWYEEDQDAAAVVLAFADRFTDKDVRFAVETAKLSAKWSREYGREVCGWYDILDWLENSFAGREVAGRAEQHQQATSDLWQLGGICSGAGFPDRLWQVNLYRKDERRTVLMPYPSKQFYTDAEIAELEYKPAAQTEAIK